MTVRRGPAPFVALMLVAAACGTSVSPAPTPGATPSAPASASPSAPPASPAPPTATPNPSAVYASVEADVEGIRQLQPKEPVDPTVLDSAALNKLITDDFARNNPPALVDANERLLKALGLMTAEQSLADLEVKLLSSQVAGLYDPDRKKLFVVSRTGALGPTERVTFAHEFTHALQDQNFGLKNLNLDAIGQGDRSLAHLSLPEGDATLVMSYWAQQHLTPAETLQLLAESQDPQQTAVLNSMPAILRETLLFPYTSGLSFVLGLQTNGGWAAVDAAYAKPPASTEQVLHPEKYASNEAPVTLGTPKDLAKRLGSGWTVPLTDTFGELQLRIWLRDVGQMAEADADGAAAGWGGDRIVLARKGDTIGVALLTAWDTPGDATAFASGAQKALDHLQLKGSLIHPGGGKRVTVFVATDDATINRLAGALGVAG
jgi:hypothetical protein